MRGKILKLLSMVMGSLLFLNSLNGVFYANSSDNTNSYEKSSTWNKIKENVKENAVLYSSAAAATILLPISWMFYNSSKNHIDSREFLNSTFESYLPVLPADDWFVKLGGTQKDIDNYTKDIDNYTKDIDNFTKNIDNHTKDIDNFTKDIEDYKEYKGSIYEYISISNDTARYPIDIIPNCDRNTFKGVFNRILFKYYDEHKDIPYTQGWGYPLYMIYRKFMITRDTKGTLSPDDEAKVYFIYTKFMNMIGQRFKNSKNSIDDSESFAKDFLKNSNIVLKNKEFKKIMETPDNTGRIIRSNLFLNGVFMAGVNLLGYDLATRMWDNIIAYGKPVPFTDNTLHQVYAIVVSYADQNFDVPEVQTDQMANLCNIWFGKN